MKMTKTTILSLVIMLLITSCVTVRKFPVSATAPAADITATVKMDKQKNYIIKVTANYLASVERLSPPKRTYVVWIVTKDNGVKNIGLLNSKNAQKIKFETLSSFEPYEIFISAEDDGSVSYPSGIEISRVVTKNY